MCSTLLRCLNQERGKRFHVLHGLNFDCVACVRGQESSICAFAAPPVVINFHPLPRGNVSITRQPQLGCLQFQEITSRDHVSHRFLEAKETKLPSVQEEQNPHAQKTQLRKLSVTHIVFLILSLCYSRSSSKHFRIVSWSLSF